VAKGKGVNSSIIKMVGSKAGGVVKKPAAIPAGFKGKKAGKAKASLGGKSTLKTLGGTSGIMNPPTGGGY
jgi:hypothetical protein